MKSEYHISERATGYFVTKVVICQHFKDMLTTVSWHKSEILQKQVFPKV